MFKSAKEAGGLFLGVFIAIALVMGAAALPVALFGKVEKIEWVSHATKHRAPVRAPLFM